MAAKLDLLVPEIRDAAKALVQACGEAGLLPRVTSTLRTNAEQTRLYRRYVAGQAGYPVAPPGLSAHQYGLAFDMVVSPLDALADVGATWIDWGGGWNPADAVHFELLGASDLIKKANQGDKSSADWLMSIANFVGGFPLPWYTSFIPEKYGTPTQAEVSGGVGAALEWLFSTKK